MRTRILLGVMLIGAAGLATTRCSCSTQGRGGDVDTVIVGNDTVLVSREVKRMPVVPDESAAMLDTVTGRDTVPIRKGKILSPAEPFPEVDTSAVVVDSIGRKIISDRLCVVIMKQGAGVLLCLVLHLLQVLLLHKLLNF